MKYIITLSSFFVFIIGFSQDSDRFANEVENLQKKYDTLWDASKETIVFTGSSSIRTWYNLNSLFPDHEIVNTGFGASQATDLLAYTNELILRYKPYKVFIYEGDNDLAAHKRPNEIINTTLEIVKKIRDENGDTQIILIAAKPCIVRWSLKRKYKRLNRKLKKLCKKDDLLQFADVWKPMLHKRKLNEAIFEADGLHMNSKGYEIWYSVIKPFMQ
jgi:lysophospholipase L1-like esterase